jgi:hypothetical protein
VCVSKSKICVTSESYDVHEGEQNGCMTEGRNRGGGGYAGGEGVTVGGEH